MYLLYTIYYSVTTHLRQGKKVSILPLSDMNTGPVPQDEAYLSTFPIVR
jgi:hypothetical protein